MRIIWGTISSLTQLSSQEYKGRRPHRLNSHRGERILEDVSRCCNHQHSLSAREEFSTRPSLSRKYSNFVLASGLVKISAICSCVGSYCMCIAFLCIMSLKNNILSQRVSIYHETHDSQRASHNSGYDHRIHLIVK